MKKVISVIMCIVLCIVSFAGCSSAEAELTEENVTATVDKAMTALKDFDSENLKKYINSETLSTILTYADKQEQFADLGRAMFANLEYQVMDIDLENKTVLVAVNNKDLSNVASDFVRELQRTYSTVELLTKLSNDTFLDSKLVVLCNKIDNAEMMDGYVDITLTIDDSGKNLVLVFDENAENQVSGGALSTIMGMF
ncbi:MAG: hypothetical protein PUE08_05530 [Eubacteriales bacterium]|nr:hypothetical protein [Eubacteriales bacterium]